jgi:hypothetical protein
MKWFLPRVRAGAGVGRLQRGGTRFRCAAAGVAGAGGAAALLAGCEPYRVEYHQRPGFYAQAGAVTDDEVTLKDGTVVVFRTRGEDDRATSRRRDEDARPLEIREERPDGSIVLRALVPEHVLANTLTCVQKEEYELIWDQILSERTRQAYVENVQGFEEFKAFFQRNRRELARTLMRLLLGIPRQEVIMENAGDGTIRCRLRPHVAREFDFTAADIVSERGGLKLLIIR